MTSLTYRPDIDGLRAVAVLAVVLNHLSASLFPGGYVGVDIFFVISGYLITGIISREMAEGRFTFAGFYERRARRIFPALFAMLLATLAVSYLVLLPSDMASTLRGTLGTVFFTSNMVFWREMKEGYFAATDLGLNPLLHTWSLSVEEQFYVLFPVLLLLCFKYARRYILLILVACAIASLAAAALFIQDKSVAVFFLAPFRAWELLAGSLLALNVIPTLRSRFWRELCAATGLVTILVACFLYDHKTTFPGMAAVLPVLGAAAVIHAGAGGSTWVGGLLQLRPMVYVGLISYSLYLWHWPLIVFVRYFTGFTPISSYIPVLFTASLLLAHFSYRFIERPFRHKTTISGILLTIASTSSACIIILISFIGLRLEGFEERFPSDIIKLDKARAPIIPFQSCNDNITTETCTLGRPDGDPDILIWGDSQALGWAPVLDSILAKQGNKAILAFSYACPPLLKMDTAEKKGCASRNQFVNEYILKNSNIKTVFMAAYWSHYFKPNSPLYKEGYKISIQNDDEIKNIFIETINTIISRGQQVVLFGPVPVYKENVPTALVFEKLGIRKGPYSTIALQSEMHAQFFEAVESAEKKFGSILFFVNPIEWLCNSVCATSINGVSLYRDSHHLNAAGALMLEPQLTEALNALRQR